MSADLGIDLGTSSILVYAKGKGIVLKEPSVVAYDKDADKIRAYGEEARQMIGRTPGNVTGIRPIRQGVITDYTIMEKMLKYFIQKAMGRKSFRKPRISICVPNGVTKVERRAMEEATYQAGARDVYIIEQPIAAAIGAGIDITKPFGNMVVDIGGGTTDIAVLSIGGDAASSTIKVAGNNFDEAIVNYVRNEHSLFVGEQTAEAIKIQIGSAFPKPQAVTMNIKGRNIVTGLPKSVVLTSDEIREALSNHVNAIVDAVHANLEKTPPELASDIAERGIVLTGGGSLLQGMDDIISQRTGIQTMTAENPACCVAIGTGLYADVMESFR